MIKMEEEAALLEKALAEEKTYNWLEAAKLYKRVAESFLKKNLLEKAAEKYKKYGRMSYISSLATETSEDFFKQINNSVDTFEKAKNLFKQTGNKSKELECRAEILYLNAFIEDSQADQEDKASKSIELLIEASKHYSNEDDQESTARTLSRAVYISSSFAIFLNVPTKIEKVFQKNIDIMEKAWNISRKIGNIQYLAELLQGEVVLVLIQTNIKSFIKDDFWREYLDKLLLKCNECINLSEDHGDHRSSGMIYFCAGFVNCEYGMHYVKEESKQKEFLDKGLKLVERSVDFARKANDKFMLLLSILYLDLWALLGGRIQYLQKRIFLDLNEVSEIGKIFSSFPVGRFFVNHFPALYYANMAQWKFFTPNQRKSFAEQGIKYANEGLKDFPSIPYSVYSYLSLTISHSQLATLINIKDEQVNHIKKMLEYANHANKIGEQYEGGVVRAMSYNSLYIAYKTLANFAKSKQERINMLKIAANASKNYMDHPIESRTGIIAAQMRLGLLYEEIGILTLNNDTLTESKEIFLDAIKESLERGYQSYAAATFEYLARIEDRLGNHTASAKYYEKAQNAYAASLENVEYKLLKKRINEKLNYVKAWNLIENAKTHHRREDNLKAKASYNSACAILENLTNFNYEANYYSAWASQEVAEQLSKQEKHREAIEQYNITKETFENAIKTLERRLNQSKEKMEVERIEKLVKVAKLRITYCTARINVENGRILAKKGEHMTAAELFASAASQFKYVCNLFKTEQERVELEAVYYLCRAWESMELAEKYEDHERFLESANLFIKASNLFTDSKLKLLASGNSSFCQALQLGCQFDETYETELKAQLYPKIKSMLRTAASSYEKGGFKNGGDWALATSTYFDAVWHLIRADEELEIENKKKLLDIGANYLKSAADLFSMSGYKDKEREILGRLKRIEQEEKILVSALNTIKKPSISSSTTGIIAPACSLETSQSPRLGEVYQFTEEERRVIEERITKKKYQIIYRDLFKEYPRVQKRECRVGIAQIGISKTGDIFSEFYEMKISGLLSLREDKVESIRSKVKKMIENAHNDSVNILVFPEMTIDLNYGELLEDISDLAKLYEMYIIPGSFHDQETKRNITMVFGPDGILWEQEKHIPAIIQHKGRKFKESIDVGKLPRNVFVCNTEFGRIAIAICRDFLDMDLRVELKNFEPAVDIILNPAFTPVTADFKAIHFDARRSIYAYCFFANVAEFGESLIYTPEKDRTERIIPAKEEGLIYKDIDLFKLRSERKKWEKEQKKERSFIQSTR